MASDWQASDYLGGDGERGGYRLSAPIAAGGGGELWEAHGDDGQSVAIKRLSEELIGDAEMVARFHREARAVASLASPHIVRVFEAGVHAEVPFIAMEHLRGESLRERLDRDGALDWEHTRQFVTQIASGMQAAHARGVVHRDLKPANVIIAGTNEGECVKIIDFGVAKVGGAIATATLKTNTGDMLGTPHYMSPEQLRSTKAVDARADVWSIGVIAYECAVGERPFDGKTLGDLVLRVCLEEAPTPSEHARVPDAFDAWFATAAARRLEDRFPSCAELLAALP